MRQFIEALLIFQLGTCRVSPVEKLIPRRIEMAHSKRRNKFLLYALIFTCLLLWQLFSFTNYKEQNYYQVLGLESTSASPDQIESNFETLSETHSPKQNPDADVDLWEKIKTAHKCLKQPDCRNEYTRFGSGITLNDPSQDFQFDWRLGFTVAFYCVFAFV